MTREKFKSPGLQKLFSVAATLDEVWPLVDGPQAFEADAIWQEKR